jgi:hypothetical protein
VTVVTRPVRPRLPHLKGCVPEHALKNLRIIVTLCCYTTNSSAKENGDGGAGSLPS